MSESKVSQPPEVRKVRIDQWLWAVRLFKTRTQAAEACKGGKVKIGEDNAKPSRGVKVGETIVIQQSRLTRTVRVLQLLSKRVGAKLVPEYVEDLTPEEEYEKLKLSLAQSILKRERGSGRPTKKERRDIDRLLGE